MKRRKLAATAATLLLAATTAAQTIDPKGDELFEAHCFEKATERYLRVFHSNPSHKANPPLLKRLARSILLSEMMPRDTARYFADLYLEFAPDDAEAYFMSARAHYHAHSFETALSRLDSFMVRTTSEEEIMAGDQLNSWIRNSRRMMRDTLRNPLINLGETINTRNNEINPYIVNDGQSLVFSCDDKFDRDAVINVYNIKSSDHSSLSWSPARKVSGINTLSDEYPSGPTPDGFFYCSNRKGDFGLYATRYSGGGRCSNFRPMGHPIDKGGSEVAACLSPSGDTLYFSATGYNGKLDIYYSIRSYNGEWMEARPIPGLVNRVESDENYPYLANGGSRLYFASDREGSMGGYDIFYSDFDLRKNEWGKPVQMPYPINDTYDNMSISLSADGRYAYLSLLRHDSYGCRDIYALIFDHVLPSSAIMRYSVRLRGANRQTMELDAQPRITISDASGDLVAIERVNLRTHSFLVVLDPGTYTMSIDLEGTAPYEERIVVEERTYEAVPIDKTITLEKR